MNTLIINKLQQMNKTHYSQVWLNLMFKIYDNLNNLDISEEDFYEMLIDLEKTQEIERN